MSISETIYVLISYQGPGKGKITPEEPRLGARFNKELHTSLLLNKEKRLKGVPFISWVVTVSSQKKAKNTKKKKVVMGRGHHYLRGAAYSLKTGPFSPVRADGKKKAVLWKGV